MLKQCSFILLIVFLPILSWSDESSELQPFKIGILFWSMDIPGQVAMREGLESEALTINQFVTEHGGRLIQLVSYVAGNGEEGIERQIKQMRTLIAQKVDVIIVQPTDNAALSKPLQEANRLGIPVVAYDQYISGGKLHSFITSDNYQAGFFDGEYIASKFDNNEIIKIILVDYPHVSSTVQRVDGFLDALAEQQQKFKILSTYEAVEPIGGQKAADAILADFPDKNSVDVIFSVNDGGGLNIALALLRAERYEILLATVDGDPQMVELIKNNRIVAIDSAQFCASIGREALRTAYAVLYGRTVAQQILIPVYPVTRETIKDYPGWHGKIPDRFAKPWKASQRIWAGNIIRKTEAD